MQKMYYFKSLKAIYNINMKAMRHGWNLVSLRDLNDPGIDGREVLMQVSDTHIQWQYQGDTTWTNLITLSSLKGIDGLDGQNGKSAYELYLENFPNYEGDEQQWLNDLINGNLGVRDTFIVTFDSDGGTSVDTQVVEDNDKATKPLDPIKAGYTFMGWFINEDERWIFGGYDITEDITLVAQWSINTYTIEFYENSGTSVSDITAEYNTSINYETTSKVGYTFDGWYEDNGTYSIAFNETNIPNRDVILYAKWVTNEYEFTYKTYIDFDPLETIPLFEGETIKSISLGLHHSSALTSIGRLFMWGLNYYGQLGDGTTINKLIPIDITSQFNLINGEMIVSASLGDTHSSVFTSTGRMFTWGYNPSGQLGDGTTIGKLIPIDITSQFNLTNGETIKSASLNDHNSSALTSTGRLFTWGYNNRGQLGDGTTVDKLRPGDITAQFNLPSEETIVSVSLGDSHSSALTSTGRLFTWGYNYSGQLGDGTTIGKLIPIDITSQFNLTNGETIKSVSLGDFHSSVFTSTGRLFTWGDNNSGQLGDGTIFRKSTPVNITTQFNLINGETIVSVSLGDFHSSALTSTGRLFTWGYNNSGQLGDGTTVDKLRPGDITAQFNLPSGETIVSTSLGCYHSSALTSTGRLFTWGYNSFSQLGDGTTINQLNPELIQFKSIFSTHKMMFDYQESIMESTPTMEHYIFDGWYLDNALSIPLITTLMPSEDLIVFANWDPIMYEITYHLDGGTHFENPSNYHFDTPNIILQQATKDGYTFDGWYDNASFSGDRVTQILKRDYTRY